MILHAISYTEEYGYTQQFCSDSETNAIYYAPVPISQEEFEQIWNQHPEKQTVIGTTKVLIL